MTNPALTPALRTALVALWTRVANAGGAVGFVAPTTQAEVAVVAGPAFDRVAAGDDDLVVALDGDAPVGLGFLARNDTRLQRHVAVVRRLQRDPEHAGRGVGGAVLAQLEAVARERGVRVLTLAVRGGTGSEGFYLRLGYRVDARLPDRIAVAGGHLVEQLSLSKRLDAAAVLAVTPLDPGLPLPSYAHPGDAGLDLHAREPVELDPGARAVVPTGVAVAIPDGMVGLVHPRSGLAARHGVTVLNAPGTIDAGYRGELKVILLNTDRGAPHAVARGDRIAQLVVQRVERVAVEVVDALPGTARGAGGLGSTGA